jgi:hypothetical protein
MKTGNLYEFTSAKTGFKWIAKYEGESDSCLVLSSYLPRVNYFLPSAEINKLHISGIREVTLN